MAITVKKEDLDYQYVALNPGHDAVIEEDTTGFFICQSEDEVKRLVNVLLLCTCM